MLRRPVEQPQGLGPRRGIELARPRPDLDPCLPSHAWLNAVQSRTDGWVTLESSLPNRSESALPKSTADELLEQRANVSRGSWWVPRWEPVARKAAAKTAAHQMKESPSR